VPATALATSASSSLAGIAKRTAKFRVFKTDEAGKSVLFFALAYSNFIICRFVDTNVCV
jgi:hypothetical protein